MELEELKAVYQQAKAAHPRKDPHAIMLDTKRKAEERERDFKRQQRAQIACGLFCLVCMAAWYRREGPLLSNAGLILMFLCLAAMLAGSIILKYRLRESHPWLPEEEFLAEQRKKIAARIALLRRNVVWFFIPSMLGFLAWQAGLSHSAQMVAALVVAAGLASAGTFWFYRWKLRTDLLPILEDIDRELESFRDSNNGHGKGHGEY